MSRKKSFLIITLVYAIAGACAIGLYIFLPFEFWLNLLICDVAATAIVFAFSLIFKNASVYDPYWSVQPIVITLALAAKYAFNLSSVLLILVIAFWGIRLTANWAYTFNGMNHQDWRYTMLCEKTGKFYPIVNFLGIHLFPTLVVYLCVLPAAFVIKEQAEFNPYCIIGLAVSFVATLLQLFSDMQMHKFRKLKSGGFIRTGLWKYSRHPNYLGEILMWWGVAISSLTLLKASYFLVAGATVNTLMFLFVSIPMADKRQSRKENFNEYKKQTRMLLPVKKFH
ncbi:MAG: DUF1295 domain-containing protein [Clostridia bacterium]|nr:DUF1295 domain-containing protein [Clostridia bacterium]